MMNSDSDSPEPAQASMSPFAVFINILTAPAEAFAELEQRPSKLVPLALVILANIAVIFWYFTILDYAWFVDDTLSISNIPEDQLEQARENFDDMSASTVRLFGMLGSSVAVLVLYTVQAGYLTLVSALAGHSKKFGHWFSLVVWAGIVVVFSQIGMAVTLLLDSGGQLGQYDLDPTTLRNLGLRPDNAGAERILGSINLTMFWSVFLMTVGYKQWLGTSTIKAVLTVCTPYFLIFGVWGFFALSA